MNREDFKKELKDYAAEKNIRINFHKITIINRGELEAIFINTENKNHISKNLYIEDFLPFITDENKKETFDKIIDTISGPEDMKEREINELFKYLKEKGNEKIRLFSKQLNQNDIGIYQKPFDCDLIQIIYKSVVINGIKGYCYLQEKISDDNEEIWNRALKNTVSSPFQEICIKSSADMKVWKLYGDEVTSTVLLNNDYLKNFRKKHGDFLFVPANRDYAYILTYKPEFKEKTIIETQIALLANNVASNLKEIFSNDIYDYTESGLKIARI